MFLTNFRFLLIFKKNKNFRFLLEKVYTLSVKVFFFLLQSYLQRLGAVVWPIRSHMAIIIGPILGLYYHQLSRLLVVYCSFSLAIIQNSSEISHDWPTDFSSKLLVSYFYASDRKDNAVRTPLIKALYTALMSFFLTLMLLFGI